MNIENTRLQYKPERIKYLLIAEAPPSKDSGRFFYFSDVKEKDGLFLETMKVLFPKELMNTHIPAVRKNKKMFLDKFKEGGFYLIDSIDEPLDDNFTHSQKINLIVNGQPILLNKIRNLISSDTKIILISSRVFKANYSFLVENKISVVNILPIDFPASGNQKKYRLKLAKAIGIE